MSQITVFKDATMTTYYSHPIRTWSLCAFIILCLFSCQQEPQQEESALKVSSGRVERLENFSSELVPPRTIDIWLPEGYSSEKNYSVLYMHDGQMLYDSTTTWNGQEWEVDEVVGELISQDKIDDVIAVGVYNSGAERHAEYFPQKPFESLEESVQDSLFNLGRSNDQPLFASDLRADGYLAFLVKELKPYIDENYATNPDASHTFVAGSSMGGLISMYAICEYPQVFGGAACLSTHWVGIIEPENNPIPAAFVSYLAENLPEPGQNKLYFDYGTETLDALYEPFQLQVDSVMEMKGYTAVNWVTQKFPGANHSEIAWAKRLHIPVSFLLGDTAD